MGMTKSQSSLRVVCIIGIPLNAIAAVLSLGAAAISATSGTASGEVLSILGNASAIAGVLFVLNVVACVLGLRGANDPSRIKPFYSFVVVLLALHAVVIAYNAIVGNIGSNMVSSFFVDLILFFLANEVKKQA